MNRLPFRFPLAGSDLTLTVVMVIGFIVLGLASGGELISAKGLQGFLAYLSVPILIGLSQMAVLAVGQLNLALGVMGGVICAIVAVATADLGIALPAALLLGLAAGVATGAINGLLVVATGLHGFIVTLGTMTMLIGLQFALLGTRTVSAASEELRAIGRLNIAGVPLVFIGTVLLAILTSMYFARTTSGRKVLATGGNSVAARLSGISNNGSLIVAYTVSGLLTAFAALATLSLLAGVNTSVGGDWLLPSFAAPLIAGVLLAGGSVSVYGTVIAACILRIVDVGRAQFLLDPAWTNFVIGAVVLFTVALSEYRKRRTASSTQKRLAVLP